MKKFLFAQIILAFVFALFPASAHADWIWRPDTGWMNSKEIVKATPEEQMQYAKRLADEGEYKKAARAYRILILSFPDSKLAGTAALSAGKCLYKAGYLYSAFLALKRASHDYADTIDLNEVVSMFNIIGNEFLAGGKKEFLGLKIFRGESSAVEVFRELHNLDPWGELGDDSIMSLGNSYMRVHDYDLAIEAFDTLIADYPKSPLLPRARLQKAKCYDIKSDSWSYDWLALSRAMEVLKEINPDADIAQQADELREVIEERLARKLFETGKFYVRRDKYKSALIYFEKVLNEFSNTLWAEKAREKIFAIKKKLGQPEETGKDPKDNKESEK